MTSQLDTVLQISAVGTAFLFAALAGLIGLMYLLTGSWVTRLFRRTPAPAETPDTPSLAELEAEAARAEEAEELDRQQRAVALAVALACAHTERPETPVTEAPSNWRQLHRARRLVQPTARASIRA